MGQIDYIKPPDSRGPLRRIDGIDENHALYGNYLGLQYVFAQALDPDVLKAAAGELLRRYPALAGRYDQKNACVIADDKGVPFHLVRGVSGAAQDYAGLGAEIGNRFHFVDEPPRRAVMSGKAVLSSIKLTLFEGGGCILGLAVNHMLLDAAGFHLLAREFGEIYSAMAARQVLPETKLIFDLNTFQFGTQRNQTEVKAALAEPNFDLPVKVKGGMGRAIRALIAFAMERPARQKRACFYFTAEQVASLKQSLQRESGEPWISTNVALGAHMLSVMSRLQYDGAPKTHIQIGQLLDLRGRYFNTDDPRQGHYVGNAIYIFTDKTVFENGIQNTPRGEIARFLKASLARLNGDFLKGRLDLTADCLRIGRSYPGLDMKDPMMSLNNQSKMPVYDLAFGEAKLLRVIPQDVGDHIMFFPARDGGVEVYVRDLIKPKRLADLAAPDWQARIFDL
ncbi:MAG: acyltransferase [Maricaulaceae bacterium]